MRCSRVRFAFPRPILTLVSVPPPPPHLRNGSGSTSTTTSMDPLGYWLLLVAFARLSSVYFGYFNLWALQVAVYSKRTMSDVHGRTFAVWTAVTCTLCILCALHLDSRPLYLATLTSFVFALLHFLLELLVYKTMTVKNFAAPCFFASVSTVWMFMELGMRSLILHQLHSSMGFVQDPSVVSPVSLAIFIALPHPPELDAYEEDEEEDYYANTLRIGNRRWGENGYVRRGRIEARPAPARSSSAAQKGQNSKEGILGRRARRAQKRTMADAGPSGSGSR
ncbi:unnamed protein product [Closterium sp. NIES-65]|nr:unnamed protein product [Closterium sp. NIES-65]